MATDHTDSLGALVESHAHGDGRCDAIHPGVYFYRAMHPVRFTKALTFGPTLTVIAQGRKQCRFGELELEYAPGSYLVVTGEGMFDGAIVEASPDAPYLSVCIELPSELVAKTLLALADAVAVPATDAVPAFVSTIDHVLQDTVVRYVRAIDDPLERRMVAPLIMEELVFRLLRSDAAAVLRAAVTRDRDADAIQRAMRYMRAHTNDRLSVEDVARHVGMSPSHFAHRFRAIARTSPMRYLKQLRLQDARALLLADQLRVSEVAGRVGYESASHFTRDFKSYFGATPAEYVRRIRTAGSGERTAVPDIAERRATA
jgi:AraC-like DNA-binding protein